MLMPLVRWPWFVNLWSFSCRLGVGYICAEGIGGKYKSGQISYTHGVSQILPGHCLFLFFFSLLIYLMFLQRQQHLVYLDWLRGKNCCWVWLFFFLINLFIYFWLRWVFVAVRGLSLVVVSGGYSSLRCTGFSSRWLLLLRNRGCRHAGFSSCGTWAQ